MGTITRTFANQIKTGGKLDADGLDLTDTFAFTGTVTGAGLSGWSEDGANNNLLPASSSAGIYLGVNSATASNLLDDYEEGTWTPTDESGASLTFATSTGQYVKIGNMVYLGGNINYPSNSSSADMIIGGLPFLCADIGAATQYGVAAVSTNVGNEHFFSIGRNTTRIFPRTNTNGVIANSVYSSKFFQFFGHYQTT